MDARHEDRWRKGSSSDRTIFAPAGISPRRRNPEEALVIRAYIKESTYSWNIQSVCQKKTLDLLEQVPRGIGR